MNKLKIFLSSRVNSAFTTLDQPFTLADLRQFLREKLEAEKFLEEKILQVSINESNFNASIAKNAFDTCMAEMRTCNIIIILYNGEAGWSVTGNTSTNGICHEELLIAAESFADMSFAIDLSGFFTLPASGDAWKRNQAFQKDVNESFIHKETIKAAKVDDLKKKVLKQIHQYILKAVEKSFQTQKQIVAASATFGATLDWSKMSYQERDTALRTTTEECLEKEKIFTGVIKAYHAVPDNMSVSEARNMTGRPFLHEHELVRKQTNKCGVIHFVAVYGNATEMQAKNMVGYPDLTVIKTSFGLYLWEKNMHIQMFFLKQCINHQTVKTRVSELINWLNSSRELNKIINRAKARFTIMDAVNKAAGVDGL
ncbi:MAG: hypothetical protein JST86_14645 [Bacteroidetes bacterium]|nr:hypothetical protein [Bacteroidota bacterium]